MSEHIVMGAFSYAFGAAVVYGASRDRDLFDIPPDVATVLATFWPLTLLGLAIYGVCRLAVWWALQVTHAAMRLAPRTKSPRATPTGDPYLAAAEREVEQLVGPEGNE